MNQKTPETLVDDYENEYQAVILKAITNFWEDACHKQTKPDGKNCAICSDNDHQAFECHYNAFNIWKELNK